MSSHACARPARATIAVAPRLARLASAPRIARAHRSTRLRATSTSAGSTNSSSDADASRAPYVGPPRVVILGGGFGGLYTALKLDALTWPDASKRPVVTLVDRAERFVFKPMLYELVNETMSDWEVAPAFEDLLEPTSVRYVRGDVAAVRTGDEVPFADGTHRVLGAEPSNSRRANPSSTIGSSSPSEPRARTPSARGPKTSPSR